MSEQTKSEVTTTAEVQPEVSTTQPSLDEVLAKLSQAEQTNKRLLAESKENKQKAQLAKEELDRKEMEALSKSKDHEKMNEMLKAKIETERATFNAFKKNALSKFLDAEILKHAPDAQDVTLIKQSLPADLINVIEEDNEIKFTGLKEGIEHVKKSKTFLFKSTSNVQMATGKPSVNNAQPSKATQLNQMKTSGDILDFWKANPHIK